MMKRSIHYRLLFPLLLLSVLVSCNKLRNWKYNPPNVLLISVEGLNRALPCYGDTVLQAPNIERLARRAVVFEDALAQHPSAKEALTSIFTGWYPNLFWTIPGEGPYLNSLFPGLESGDYRIAFPGLKPQDKSAYDPIRVAHFADKAELETPTAAGNAGVTEQVYGLWSKYEGDPFFINAHYQMKAVLQDSNQVAYQDALTEVDREVGRLLDQLMDIQEASNTIVILLGVNPMGIGPKDLEREYFKPQYVKVPFLYYDFRQDSSYRVPQLTELRSLFPTLVERCFVDGQKTHACNAPTVQQILDGNFGKIQYPGIGISNNSRYHALYTSELLHLTEYEGKRELFRLSNMQAEQLPADSVVMDSLGYIYHRKYTLSTVD
jgi:membrane-anchored protein YejM (alkaline phosphatase superfamily)